MINITLEQINNAFEKINPIKEKAYLNLKMEQKKKDIASKYSTEKQIKDSLYLYMTYLELDLIELEKFEQTIIDDLKIEITDAHKIYIDVKKEIIDNIEKEIEKMRGFDLLYEETKKEEEENTPPPPPYLNKTEPLKNTVDEKKEDLVPKKEENIYEKNGIEFIKENEELEIEDKNESDEKIVFEDSGINVVEEEKKENNNININENKDVMLENIEHPESIASGILGDKLRGSFQSKTTTTDYSLPKIGINKTQ